MPLLLIIGIGVAVLWGRSIALSDPLAMIGDILPSFQPPDSRAAQAEAERQTMQCSEQ